MLSIHQAATQGITRLRKPIWADPCDHIKIDIFDGGTGPWIHLFCPYNECLNGKDPVNILFTGFDFDCEEWEAFGGPLPDTEEYKTRKAELERLDAMSNHGPVERGT